MDIARPARPRAALRYAAPLLFAAGVAALGIRELPGLFHRATAEPVVDRSALVLDIVRRGTLMRSIHAGGRLVSGRVQIVAAAADGFVDDVAVRAGSRVQAGSVIAVLRNPDLDAAVASGEAQLAAAEAEAASAREAAAASHLDQDAAYRSARAQAQRSGEEARSYRALHAAGLVSDLAFRESLIQADENRGLAGIQQRKLAVDAAGDAARIAEAAAKVAQVRAELAARQAEVAALTVRAGADGIVQSMSIDRGQRVTAGAELARVAASEDLKAVLDVAEGDLHSVVPGLAAAIDTGGTGTVSGRVARIAPDAAGGAVTVDVTLAGVPAGARPEQNVDGTIVLSRVRDALSIARPAGAADDSTIALYRLSADRTHALRTSVRLATGSLDRVQVAAGLAPGDAVIVSDTSAYDAPELKLQ